MSSVLYDAAGPRARRNIRIGTAVGGLVLIGLFLVVLNRLGSNGQLEAERWKILTNSQLQELLARALVRTLQAAAIAMVLSMVIGALLTAGRLSERRWVRTPVTVFVELFRALPLLLLILFAALALPQLGLRFSVLWYLVIGLTAYNSAVLCEIFRAGILSIDRGQSEAAYAIGLRPGEVLRLILVPQAVRRMLPALISQLVTLLKDTSLGFVIAYDELLRTGRGAVEFLGSRFAFQVYVLVALIYIAVNLALSTFARWLDRRQSRRYGAGAVVVNPEDPLGQEKLVSAGTPR
jgi:glutamate transport system permease protein